MVRAERFELRDGREVWAALCVDPDSNKTLEHALTEDKISRCGGVGVYDSTGRMLSINQGDKYVYLDAPGGTRRLKLQLGSEREILDVVDPKHQVQLVIELSLSRPGSSGTAPIKDSSLVFNFRWIA
ncbi:MAG: hypothetical protein ACE5JU_21255 [Candidatus Binatia bacterium]